MRHPKRPTAATIAPLPPTTKLPWASGVTRLLVIADVANLTIRLREHGRRFSFMGLAKLAGTVSTESHVFSWDTGEKAPAFEQLSRTPLVTLRTFFQPRQLGGNVDAEIVLFLAEHLRALDPDALLLLSGDGGFLPALDWAKRQPRFGLPLRLGVLAVPGSLAGSVSRYLGDRALPIGLDLTIPLDGDHT